MSEQQLLKLLADGDYHSGEELGELLGVSRTAVWKQINKLSALGVSVESVKGKGYCIPAGMNLLDDALIKQQLSAVAKQQLKTLVIEQSITSTNELARQRAEVGDATGLAILAEQQTAGRGRRGRSWVSPFGRNLYLSLVWGFDGGAEAIEGLSLAVGVATRRAIEHCGVSDVQLKWPNDLLWQKQKIGGILLEIIGDPSGFCQVVIGVGLNVGMPAQEASEIGQPWADINQIARERVDRNVLAGCLLDELLLLLADYEQQGFAASKQEWMAHDAFADSPVQLTLIKRSIQGVARGVTDSGALILDLDGELQQFSGGEISLRGIE